MKILVFELACASSGFESSVIHEGFEMLNMAAGGLKRAEHDVTVILNPGLDFEKKIKAKNIVEIQDTNPGELAAEIIKTVKQKNCGCVFPIAPDFYLAGIVRKLRLHGIEVIASKDGAIEIAADKWKTYNALKEAGIKTPGTKLFSGMPMKYPFIIKPRTGVACENLFKINGKGEFQKFKNNFVNKNFIIQEFIEGEDVSVTLFSDGKRAVPVCLNRQYLNLTANGSRYLGGIVPYKHPLKDDAFETAKSAVQSIPGLTGAVGVDLVISKSAHVIEINPRVTTSMAALDKLGFNVSESALLSYKGNLSNIKLKKIKDTFVFSHKFSGGKSTGIEFKKLKDF